MAVTNLFNTGRASVAEGISAVTNIGADLVGAIDPKLGRLLRSGLQPGGLPRQRQQIYNAETQVTFSINNFADSQDKDLFQLTDRRVRISLGPRAEILYQASDPGSVLSPLKATNGIIFPYTPKIDTVFQTQYQDLDIVHTNYSYYAYQKSAVSSITINADFTAQTPTEARYVMAVIHFFRSASKMFMGADTALAGNPPPILFLNGYGDYYFPNVSCLLTQFGHSMPDDVDYISAPSSDSSATDLGDSFNTFSSSGSIFSTRVPTISSVQLVLQPVYSRKKVGEFSLEKFARGEYLKEGYI